MAENIGKIVNSSENDMKCVIGRLGIGNDADTTFTIDNIPNTIITIDYMNWGYAYTGYTENTLIISIVGKMYANNAFNQITSGEYYGSGIAFRYTLRNGYDNFSCDIYYNPLTKKPYFDDRFDYSPRSRDYYIFYN